MKTGGVQVMIVTPPCSLNPREGKSLCECKKTVSDIFVEIDIFTFSERGGNYAHFKPILKFQHNLIKF